MVVETHETVVLNTETVVLNTAEASRYAQACLHAILRDAAASSTLPSSSSSSAFEGANRWKQTFYLYF